MRIRVEYTYYSEYNGGDPCYFEHEIPDEVDLEKWVDENYPLNDYGDEGEFNNWNPQVFDMNGNLLYERKDGQVEL